MLLLVPSISSIAIIVLELVRHVLAVGRDVDLLLFAADVTHTNLPPPHN